MGWVNATWFNNNTDAAIITGPYAEEIISKTGLTQDNLNQIFDISSEESLAYAILQSTT